MARIVLVNERDDVIGSREREALLPTDIHRASNLWLTNSQGGILLAQRVLTKKIHPGKWGPAVTGTVDEGEDYDTTIIKEISEEIGLTLTLKDLTRGHKTRVKEPSDAHFAQWYSYVCDMPAKDFRLQQEEVAQVTWISREELVRAHAAYPENYVPAMAQWEQLF